VSAKTKILVVKAVSNKNGVLVWNVTMPRIKTTTKIDDSGALMAVKALRLIADRIL
jgi:hypothetical protein